MPKGTLRLEKGETLTLQGGNGPVPVTRYDLTGIDLSPMTLLIDDKGDPVILSPWGYARGIFPSCAPDEPNPPNTRHLLIFSPQHLAYPRPSGIAFSDGGTGRFLKKTGIALPESL